MFYVDRIRDAQKLPDVKIVCVMMGGDGGLTHSVKMLSRKTDISKISFVTLPFGSGNDTARCFGWGDMPWDEHLESLANICLDISDNSTEEKLNIWDVEIVMNPNKCDVWKVDSSLQEVSVKTGESLQLDMANYFSIGKCAQVGYNFD